MTAPMTPRDPFTDEDVRKALDAMRDEGCFGDIPAEAVISALLAGTERLRAQGTWNEAIEAAAKECSPNRFADEIAAAIRALKRPEAP